MNSKLKYKVGDRVILIKNDWLNSPLATGWGKGTECVIVETMDRYNCLIQKVSSIESYPERSVVNYNLIEMDKKYYREERLKKLLD